MSHVATLTVQGNPLIGLYAVVTDTYAIVGDIGEQALSVLRQTLQVPLIVQNIAATPFAGIFLCANSRHVFAPDILLDNERDELHASLQKIHVKLHLVNTKFTALGNSICVTDSAMFISPQVEKNVFDDLSKTVQLPLHRIEITDTDVVGSSLYITSRGILAHPQASDELLDQLEELCAVQATRTTVCFGSPHVRSGVLANKFGFVIGSTSSGPEMANADKAFGFLK
jgi:translation initiation factor 6